eukprot:2227331-Pyramimonas_sp.AAC.1
MAMTRERARYRQLHGAPRAQQRARAGGPRGGGLRQVQSPCGGGGRRGHGRGRQGVRGRLGADENRRGVGQVDRLGSSRPSVPAHLHDA